MIPEVKCRRCGESFSSLRSRCPNCGTRRVTQSGRTPGPTPGAVKGTAAYERAETNTKWQMIFGLILVVAVILAVIVMVSTTLDGADQVGTRVTPPMATPGMSGPIIEAPPSPSPTPPPTVERIEIKYYEKTLTDCLMHLGDPPLPLNAAVYPLTIQNPKVTWSVSDDTVLQITPSEDGMNVELNIIGTIAGGVKLTAECYGVETSIIVYCVN